MIFTIQTDDEVAGLDITNALSSAGIKHTIISKQNDNAAQQKMQRTADNRREKGEILGEVPSLSNVSGTTRRR